MINRHLIHATHSHWSAVHTLFTIVTLTMPLVADEGSSPSFEQGHQIESGTREGNPAAREQNPQPQDSRGEESTTDKANGEDTNGDSSLAPSKTDRSWVLQRVEGASPSIALITVHGRGGKQIGLGTGFVVSADGLLATNLHVIGEARPIKVKFPGGREYAVTEVHASDRQLDLAVVRIDATDLKPLELATEKAPRVGVPIIALGNPMGLRNSVVTGVVSGVREIDGREMLQLAMPIEPGNSGGPVLDQQGRVLGVITMKSAVTANLGFAVAVPSLRRLLDQPNPVAMERWKTIGSLDPNQWEPLFGASWRRQAGRIAVEGSGDGFGGRSLCLSKGDVPDAPYEVATFVRLEDESGAAGLVFGSDGQDRHFGFYASAGRLRLTRFDGPSVYNWSVLREFDSKDYERGEWNHLKVRVERRELICFVNDEEQLRYPLPSEVKGRVGLAKFRDTVAQFKNFRIADRIERVRPTPERLQSVRDQLDQLPDGDLADLQQIDALTVDSDASQFAIRQRTRALEAEVKRLRQLSNDIHTRDTIMALKAEVVRDEDQVSLAKAALLIARLDNPDLDIDSYMSRVESMASSINGGLNDDSTVADRVEALHRFLFQDNGFHGSRTNYYHAANSYFDRVLDDREGLPITLSVLYLELAGRVGIEGAGIGMPGHFLVGVTQKESKMPEDMPVEISEESGAVASEEALAVRLVDVFDGGTELSRDQAKQLCESITQRRFDESFLAPVDKRTIVLRILQNLLGSAQRERQSEKLLRYLSAMIELNEDDASLRGMRAVIRHETGRKKAAIQDLDWIIERAPEDLNMRAILDLRQRFERQ